MNDFAPCNAYLIPNSLDEALELLSKHAPHARVIAGGTDLLLEQKYGTREPAALIDITRIRNLDTITLDANDHVHLGPLVTHNQVVSSKLLVERAFPLARASWEVGAPQIRNRGTVAGNLLTASPANDTITPLWALDAAVTLASQRGRRTVPFRDFFMGVRHTAIAPDELLIDIVFPALKTSETGTFIKLGLRRAQAISLVNVAAILDWEGTRIKQARVALGAVAPTIVRASDAESFLVGSALTDADIEQAASFAASSTRPIDDVRASAAYRRDMAAVLTRRALTLLRNKRERDNWPSQPITLGSKTWPAKPAHVVNGVVEFKLNQKSVRIWDTAGRTLLDALRATKETGGAQLTGTKEGCAEGECGACTVLLNGAAVMGCLVPAAAVDGCEVVTVEGLQTLDEQNGNGLHAAQRAFVEAGAVQCGYCTPGLLVSAARLLQEKPAPEHFEIEQALAGNLCRCTGYAKIIDAIKNHATSA